MGGRSGTGRRQGVGRSARGRWNILRTTVESAPERAYAFVQAVSEPEREEFLTSVLSLMLAQQDGLASH
ncbi:hypothetical protein [uncultured Maritimibacter sp.]|jgi:hypothetical protein|uniref:hypothetical protein n=1 Tax=uncultured Maritimibacter sp. TaxID=991866 RepID=UPI0026197132|nr:hypothetical protein [uncultured Maritimibacter sp.]